MTFGERIRQLRRAKGLTLRQLTPKVGVGFTYISRIENGRLNYGDYPSEVLIHNLAEALDGDEDELLILAEKISERIRQRVLEKPEAFSWLADLDDAALDNLIARANGPTDKQQSRRNSSRTLKN